MKMRKSYLWSISLALLICTLSETTIACTTFCLAGNGEVLFGRNYDYTVGDGLILTNKRGVVKTATVGDSANSAKWVSKYGSITFNQYGRENPTGGMNEVGLVVEQLWLDSTEYPKEDSRPTLGTQEWIQYLLDTSATTSEALSKVEGVRILSDEVKVHYLISDAAGHVASVEFISGKTVVNTGKDLAVPVLTNDTYGESLRSLAHADSRKTTPDDSLDRFSRAVEKTENFLKQPSNEQRSVAYAFQMLADVAIKNSPPTKTQWSIVYDQKRRKIYFRTLKDSQIKSIDTSTFDYSCNTNVKMRDLNATGLGDVTASFSVYTRKANRDLIERSFNQTNFLTDVPAAIRNYLAAYPEGFACDPKAK